MAGDGSPQQSNVRNSLTASSSTARWRSEEDYVVARLAVAMGHLDRGAVNAVLQAQGKALADGEALSFSQLLVREGRLGPEAVLELKAELAKYLRRCSACGDGRYLPPAAEPRSEPCRRCGGPIPVPAASQAMTESSIARRQTAFQQTRGSEQFQGDPFAAAAASGPRILGSYVLERELAKGGMGAVYRARHTETGQPYAVKVLLAGQGATEGQVHRFKREARAQMELDHEHIVKIHEVGEWEGVLYLTMDLVEGTDLASGAKDLDRPERVEVLARVARAIEHAHAHGYIHRDLKPGNVLLDAEQRPLVTDFGLAKNVGGETRLTKEGAVLGTPYYMPPEQAVGDNENIGPKSDIYSLGVLLYEVTTGTLPFEANTALELYRKICEEAPRPLADHGCLDGPLEQIIFKALEKVPEDRYEEAGDLAVDLERYLRGEPPLATQVSSTVRMARKFKKHKRSIGFVLGLIAGGLVLLIGAVLGFRAVIQHFRAQQAITRRSERVVAATSALDEARSRAAELPAPAAAVTLDGATAEARAVLTKEEAPAVDETAALRRSLVAAQLDRGRAGLNERTRSGARAARDAAEGVLAAEVARPQDRVRASLLAARALLRLGEADAVPDALARLEEEAPGDGRVALLRGDVALAEGRPEDALAAFGSVDDEVLASRALLGEGRALLRLDRAEDAAERFRAAVEASPRPARALCERAEAYLATGALEPASAAFRRALEHAPSRLPAAQGLLFTSRVLGRASSASAALEQAARRGEDAAVRAAHLRARLALGEEVEPGELEASAVAALLRADVAAARGAPTPYASLPEDPSLAGDPRPLAARARARAARGELEAARSDVAALEDTLADVPADGTPSLRLGRAIRDTGWAQLALGQQEKAARSARVALRARPGDLDAAILLARADSTALARARAVFEREGEAIDGPLARGLLLARLAVFREDADLAGRARRLLTARLAGDPGVVPAHHGLASLGPLLGGEVPRPPDPPGEEVLDWEWLVPPVKAPEVSEEERAEAQELAEGAQNDLGLSDEERRDELQQALELDPENQLARRAYPRIHTRLSSETIESHLEWLRYTRHCPSFLPAIFLRVRALFLRTKIVRPPVASETDDVLARDPDDPLRQTWWVLERYFGVLYPEDGGEGDPMWRPAPPQEIRAKVGEVLRRDPRLFAVLWIRAHLGHRTGRHESADRDLELVERLARDDVGRFGDADEVSMWRAAYRAWILSSVRPKDALAAIANAERDPPRVDGRDKRHLMQWLSEDPGFAPIRDEPPFQRFLDEFNKE